MSLISNHVQLHFFKNKEMNHLYSSVFLITIGETLINIFVPIYLYTIGFEIFKILFFYFLVSFYFLIFSFLGAKITSRVGAKHSMIISSPFLILFYLGLININPQSFLSIFILPLFLSFRMILNNYGFHLNFIYSSNKDIEGEEIAFFGILTILATIASPFIGGIILASNPNLLFITSSLFIAIGTLPLLLSKDRHEKLNFSENSLLTKLKNKKNRGNLVSFSGYAIESIINRVLWPIFLILIIGSINKTGLVISISLFLSLATFYFLGKITDKMNKIRLLKIGTVLYFFAWIGRIFANNPSRIIFIDTYKNLSEKILHIPWAAHSYDLANQTNYFEFIVLREIEFNLVRVVLLPILMIIFFLNISPFLISFLIASIASLGFSFINK